MSTGKPLSGRRLLFTAFYLLLWPTLVLWLSGDWMWLEGWCFGRWFVALCVVTVAWLLRHDPALLAERYRRPGTGGEGRGDTLIVYGLGLGFLAWIVIMPLDARRFAWTARLPRGLEPVGAALLLASSFLMFRAYTDNPYLSALVRIQADRGQRLVTTGVYGFVRHPMYLGAVAMFRGAPLLTGSRLGLAVGAAVALLLVVRIVGEERLLARELEGYAEYRRRVRWRLLPPVW